MTERLVAAAIIRDGVTESRGFKSHADIRGALGDADPYKPNPHDVEGFLTSDGRFVGRGAAALVGHKAGQVSSMGGRLLSSDVNWEGHPKQEHGEKTDSLKKLLRK